MPAQAEGGPEVGLQLASHWHPVGCAPAAALSLALGKVVARSGVRGSALVLCPVSGVCWVVVVVVAGLVYAPLIRMPLCWFLS